jgi:hypothetical protein
MSDPPPPSKSTPPAEGSPPEPIRLDLDNPSELPKSFQNVKQVPARERIPFRVFLLTTEIVVLTLVMYFILLLWDEDFEKFGAAAVGPVLTVFAGATGYYFGNRSATKEDD